MKKRRTKRMYEVVYDGLWLGGVAVVKAFDPEEARAIVESHPKTVEFKHVRVREIEGPVFYNDNGDY